ncbi:two pore domain potassium channel family protein [Oleiagrimonas sp. C23AA]|nr:two pore domain potassium channel family protein [Oleiagrimonas sp. C23AA]
MAILASGAYPHWGINAITALVTMFAVAACVLLHYECLTLLSRSLTRVSRFGRRRVLHGIFGVLAVHVAEIWVFALALFALVAWDPRFGQVHGIDPHALLDHVYFSAVTFSTVGFGDVIPVGPIRFLVGTEALTGFVLITWSASFTYLEMERHWRRN